MGEHGLQKTASLLQDEPKRGVLLRTLPWGRPCLGWGRDPLDSTAGLVSIEGGGLGFGQLGLPFGYDLNREHESISLGGVVFYSYRRVGH